MGPTSIQINIWALPVRTVREAGVTVDPKLVDVDVSKVIKQLLRELRVALRN